MVWDHSCRGKRFKLAFVSIPPGCSHPGCFRFRASRKGSTVTGLETLRQYLCMDGRDAIDCGRRTVVTTLTWALLGSWEASAAMVRTVRTRYTNRLFWSLARSGANKTIARSLQTSLGTTRSTYLRAQARSDNRLVSERMECLSSQVVILKARNVLTGLGFLGAHPHVHSACACVYGNGSAPSD